MTSRHSSVESEVQQAEEKNILAMKTPWSQLVLDWCKGKSEPNVRLVEGLKRRSKAGPRLQNRRRMAVSYAQPDDSDSCARMIT